MIEGVCEDNLVVELFTDHRDLALFDEYVQSTGTKLIWALPIHKMHLEALNSRIILAPLLNNFHGFDSF